MYCSSLYSGSHPATTMRGHFCGIARYFPNAGITSFLYCFKVSSSSPHIR